ncbi:alanine-tRNA ligase, partial [Anncaliia algerae PRA339]
MSLKLNSKELKEKFLLYFEGHNHKIIESSSVVPYKDNSLLFVNSGMVQFKNNLLGIPNAFSGIKRATSSQRCIRAGGKHNDLDDVGKDTYHHTFFEMLGNWSFGDYFKEEAIFYAFDFLINELKLNINQMYVTYFSDPNASLEEDLETFNIWKKYLPENKIIKGSFKDNFWEMAETGPCGPCTEIHYDRVGGRDAAHLVNTDDPEVIEVWNVVFMEYNRTSDSFIKLEKKCVDTGIGFERLLSIVNDLPSNYKTDLFTPLFLKIEEHTKEKYNDSLDKRDTAYRILADHSRTIAVCLYDKVNYSNEGRGYVFRRITRRALRYAYEVLNLPQYFMCNLVKLASELLNIKVEIDKLKEEEDLFSKTLKRGTALFYKMIADNKISGKDAFILYDTYGFPFDLTKILAEENNLTINEDEFNKEKEIAKLKSKEKKATNENNLQEEIIKNIHEIILLKNIQPINDSFKYVSNEIIANLIHCENTFCIFDKTCFYAELGGQVGDTGVIEFINDNEIVGTFEVDDTQLINNVVVHIGKLSGKPSSQGKLIYNEERRNKIRKNHSATHLLNHFLRKYICKNITQKGSLVSDDKLRFDFDLNRSLTLEEVKLLEDKINEVIELKVLTQTKVIKKEEINDQIITLEGEEYSDEVNNVIIYDSQELCGGTHVKNTYEIGKFRIFHEGSVSSNTRRIVAKTGKDALMAESLINDINVPLENIPLLERKKREELNKLALKEELNAFKKEINNEVKELEIFLLNKKTESLNKEKSFVIFKSNLKLKKEIQKHLLKLIGLFKKYNTEGMVYYFDNDKVYFNITNDKYITNVMNVTDNLFYKNINDIVIGYGNSTEDKFNTLK